MTITVTVTVRSSDKATATTTATLSCTSLSSPKTSIPPALPTLPAHPTAASAHAGVRASVLGPVLGGVLVGALLLYACLFCVCRRRRRRVHQVHPFLGAASAAAGQRDTVSPGSEKVQGFGEVDMGARVARVPARAWFERDSDMGYLSASTLKSLSVLVSPKESVDAPHTTPGRAWVERDSDIGYLSASTLRSFSVLITPKEGVDAPRWEGEEMETPPDYVSTIQGLDPVKLE